MTLPAVLCEECGGVVEGKVDEHREVCAGPRARQWRIRHFREPGFFPISYSAAKDYEECERLWHWKYVLGGVDESGDAARLGTALHRYIDAKVRRATPPHFDVPLELTREWAEMRLVLDEVAEDLLADPDLIGTEYELFATLPIDATKVQARGLLDTLSITPSGEARVIDFKSGYKLPSEEDLRLSGSQGLWNAWLIRENFGHVYRVEFELRPLRAHAKAIVMVYDTEDIDRFQEALVLQLETMVTDREWKPRPGELRCRRCPLLLRCDAGMALSQALVPQGDVLTWPAITTPQEASGFAQRLVIAEAVVEAARKILHDFTEWYGPVPAGEGKAYAHHEERWKEMDVLTFFERMREAGKTNAEILACLKVDMKQADRYIWGRQRPKTAPVKGLREALKYTLHTKFGLRKLKGELLDDQASDDPRLGRA